MLQHRLFWGLACLFLLVTGCAKVPDQTLTPSAGEAVPTVLAKLNEPDPHGTTKSPATSESPSSSESPAPSESPMPRELTITGVLTEVGFQIRVHVDDNIRSFTVSRDMIVEYEGEAYPTRVLRADLMVRLTVRDERVVHVELLSPPPPLKVSFFAAEGPVAGDGRHLAAEIVQLDDYELAETSGLLTLRVREPGAQST